MQIYVASSWRNPHQPAVVRLLSADHDVYDFTRPGRAGPFAGKSELPDGFHWSDIDPEWESWDPEKYRASLGHDLAQAGFRQDKAALDWCDALVLVHPCGRSAHLELGYACGTDKWTAAYYPLGVEVEPELMNLLADEILVGEEELLRWASSPWALHRAD